MVIFGYGGAPSWVPAVMVVAYTLAGLIVIGGVVWFLWRDRDRRR